MEEQPIHFQSESLIKNITDTMMAKHFTLDECKYIFIKGLSPQLMSKLFSKLLPVVKINLAKSVCTKYLKHRNFVGNETNCCFANLF